MDNNRSNKINTSFSDEVLYAPLFNSENLNINGSHRFVEIAGYKGFQPTSLKTRANIHTTIHQHLKGTLTFWFSPMEDLSFFPSSLDMPDVDKNAFNYPLISDANPPRDVVKINFGIFWSNSYPQLLAKFVPGAIWGKLDFGLPPFVYAEKLKLRRGCWYFIALTWDQAEKQIRLYVNGLMVGYNNAANGFQKAGEYLNIGNPMMVMRDLVLEKIIFSAEEIKKRYNHNRPESNDPADKDIQDAYIPSELPELNFNRDNTWKQAYSCSFLKQEDFEKWHFQTGDKYRDLFNLKITKEGLLIQTPDIIDMETRMFLWSPVVFEGDQWIEYDFRLESPKGLSLLVVCASGLQRDDFIQDIGLEKTGSMQIILSKTRNYHWEFVRRVDVIRADVETQYLAKNPMDIRMFYSCIPRFEQNRWYRLRFIKCGNRLHGSIDDKTVFDVIDNPFYSTGPVYNYGRIGLRQMYNTTMRYRNMSVYVRNIE